MKAMWFASILELATLNLSVIDRDTNRGVVGLTQSDFQLFENGLPQQILQFDSSSALLIYYS